MRDRGLYQQILGVPQPWLVTDVELKLDDGQVEVLVSMPPNAELRCPTCQGVCPRYDKRSRRWRHLDTCQYQTVLVADVPRVQCAEHGIKQIDVPWAEERSRFTALFEILVIGWLKEASVNAVSRQLNLGWDAIDGIMERAVARGLARRDTTGLYPDLDVDETAFRKRHDYVTVISDPGTKSVIYLCDDRKK
jgi:transposase